MIRSMTGFGDAFIETDAGVLRAEIRTVNHRFFSLNVRSPSALDRYESKIRDWLKEQLSRGHINLTYRFEGQDEDSGPRLALDTDRARQYVEVFRQLAHELGLPGDVDIELLAAQPDLVVREQPDAQVVSEETMEAVTREAATAVVRMREREGRNLREDLDARLAAIGRALDTIAERAPARLVTERDRLRRAVAELASEASVDEDRLAREVAIMADRWDIGEEVVRLRSHIDHFRGMLDEDAAEPVGKRLSFLVQEMHREANTIGSKANDAGIEHRVVDIKNEIERLREQVENVE
jgi:uncharacterized protein (TIGR00255 family)